MQHEAGSIGDPGRIPGTHDDDAHGRDASDPGVTIVVPTRDRPDRLATVLDALAACRRPHDAIVVVDSASRTPVPAGATARVDAAIVRCAVPGASRARNAGWHSARTPIVAFVDDDCVPAPGWVAALAAAFADPGVAFAIGRVTAAPGELPLSVLDEPAPRRLTGRTPMDRLGSSCNLAVRRDVLAALGGFDEVLGAGAPLRASEDKDLQWRILDAGWEGRYVPTAHVVHASGRSRRAALRVWAAYGMGEGALAAKLQRLDGGRAPTPRSLLADALARTGRDLRAGYRFGVLAGLCRAGGVVAGARAARRYRVVDGRFVP